MFFKLTPEEVYQLLKPKPDPEGKAKLKLLLIGTLLTPITLGGALWGYVRAYNRKLFHLNEPPTLNPLHPFARQSMKLFAAVVWALILAVILFFGLLFLITYNKGQGPGLLFRIVVVFVVVWIVPNALISLAVLRKFELWRGKMFSLRTSMNKFGSAKFADAGELTDLEGNNGIYIGGGYTYSKQGHLITVAGTRSGKFTNLIAPNLLGAGGYEGSWFVIDPKGECAFVTARYQRETGKHVRIIDPWKVYSNSPDTYNPLDIIPSDDPEALSDDAAMIAEMMVPSDEKTNDPFWNNRARSIINALIIHCVLESAEGKCECSLTTVWRWLRMDDDGFKELLGDMVASDNEIVSLSANEAQNTMNNSIKQHGSIMSNCYSQTDFLKSPMLQGSISGSSFDIKELSKGNTSLYVIIPPDKMDSQSKWLRLVVATSLRAVVRNRDKKVTFILDEFSSLGKIKDVSSFMAMGAGYNISLWPILQSLSQLKDIYGNGWEVFMAGATAKHFFGVGDNFTAEYVSKMAGQSTYMVYDRSIIGPDKGNPQARALMTPDEIRRGSNDKIFTFIEQRPIAVFEKFPYYEMGVIQDRADKNPYYVSD
ncbi:type IV secretory system conjugative DNA transfer family protein [Dyadobacter psychrotolerans]|uniref:Type IV secretory system conjugative DNA transfer family protein n=1 Tax=Dyadobacter psychrotolerans TaxID=2541721 RepID=A0A4R5DZU9_9BACT|nr:type IV secretory system conjugative DNA transfer family protein [Dyadobacter psychrotolerans]TDE17741.1 type IV secretory system conjugative DNA transfer family protein [Dyadobacter psychrotolerans]